MAGGVRRDGADRKIEGGQGAGSTLVLGDGHQVNEVLDYPVQLVVLRSGIAAENLDCLTLS